MLSGSAEQITSWMAWGMLLTAPIVLVVLLKRTAAPYGRCVGLQHF